MIKSKINQSPSESNNITIDIATKRIDIGLLVLRIGSGLSLFLVFAILKLKDSEAYFVNGQPWPFVQFMRGINFPAPVLSSVVQTLNESICGLLIACGLMTRISGALLAFGFLVAFFCSMKAKGDVIVPGYFVVMFATLALTGPGRFSIDHLLQTRRKR